MHVGPRTECWRLRRWSLRRPAQTQRLQPPGSKASPPSECCARRRPTSLTCMRWHAPNAHQARTSTMLGLSPPGRWRQPLAAAKPAPHNWDINMDGVATPAHSMLGLVASRALATTLRCCEARTTQLGHQYGWGSDTPAFNVGACRQPGAGDTPVANFARHTWGHEAGHPDMHVGPRILCWSSRRCSRMDLREPTAAATGWAQGQPPKRVLPQTRSRTA